MRVCRVGTYEDILVEGENTFLEDLLSESKVCRPCHELCKACVGPNNTFGMDCSNCAVAVNLETFQCISGCDNNTGTFVRTL